MLQFNCYISILKGRFKDVISSVCAVNQMTYNSNIRTMNWVLNLLVSLLRMVFLESKLLVLLVLTLLELTATHTVLNIL